MIKDMCDCQINCSKAGVEECSLAEKERHAKVQCSVEGRRKTDTAIIMCTLILMISISWPGPYCFMSSVKRLGEGEGNVQYYDL